MFRLLVLNTYGKLARTLFNRPDFDFDDIDSPEDDGPENITEGLISGDTPAVKPMESGRGLQYHSLVRGPGDRKKPELIRVLIVHPPDWPEQDLECSIEVALLPRPDDTRDAEKVDAKTKYYQSLGHEYEYTALSYSWEGQTPTENIHIRQPGSSRLLSLQVTKNLKAALLQMRDSREDRVFWADAVCMNQDDKAEKNQQLPLMPRIYGEAKQVYVWLGDKDPKIDASKAFKLIKKIRRWEDYKIIVEKKTTCDEWDAFIALMNRGWFRRRWIVQEIVLAGADNAELWWGSEHIPWVEFAQAVAFFEGGLRNRVKDIFRANPEYEHHPDMFGEVQEFNATRLVKVTAEIVSRRDDGRVVRKRETLESLISTLTPFDTGQPHDIVYAVLSLAKDVSAGSPTVKIKSEIQLEDLPRTMRIDCPMHSPLLDFSRLFALALLIILAGLSSLAIMNSSYNTLFFSLGSLDQFAIYFSRHKIPLWVPGIAFIVCIYKITEIIIKTFCLWIYDSAVKISYSAVGKFHDWQKNRSQGFLDETLKESKTSKTHCVCEHRRRLLNTVMRRLKQDRFPVDYDKSFDEVCQDLYSFTTDQSMSLDLTLRPWCPVPPTQKTLPHGERKWLPTWVRSLDERPFKPDQKGHIQRVNADTLVGTPGTSPYQASGKIIKKWRFDRDGETHILSSPGFQLDVIERMAGPAELGIVPKGWLKSYRNLQGGDFSMPQPGDDQETPSNVSTQFWRTMIAGKGPNGLNPPLSYSLVSQELFNSEDGINLISVRDRSTNEVLKEFINRVLSVIWCRKLALTSKFKRLALLPYETQHNDVICILYGCSVPVVLRKIEETTLDGSDMWELVGECYVYEMMAGEALAERLKRKGTNKKEREKEKEFFKIRDFKIR
jgi:hypothetical protein